MRIVTITCLVFHFIATLLASPTYAATIHVPADQPTVQAGINTASSGDLVLVAPGSYMENIDFHGKAIILQSEAGSESTILDGGKHGSVVYFVTGENENSALSGFTIRNGDSSLGGGIYCSRSTPSINHCTITKNHASMAGGVGCLASSPTITNCMVLDNSANLAAGGIGCLSGSPTISNSTISGNRAALGGGIGSLGGFPTITNCSIQENVALISGGGIGCLYGSPTITECTISRNIATDGIGGGISSGGASGTVKSCTISNNTAISGGGLEFSDEPSMTVTDCTITANTATDGGGIHCYQSSPTIVRCSISGNRASDDGGGVVCESHYSSPTIESCIIHGNSADDNGGGIFLDLLFWTTPISITNTIISENRAYNGGGLNSYVSAPELKHCTFYKNTAEGSGGGAYLNDSSSTITNCIMWEDSAAEYPEIQVSGDIGGLEVSYSDIQGGWQGEGNIDADPMFFGGEGFHLSAQSPCVDAGTDTDVYTDIDGQSRPWGYGFDIGADELSTEPCSTIASSGNQFLGLYLIPVLGALLLSRRYVR